MLDDLSGMAATTCVEFDTQFGLAYRLFPTIPAILCITSRLLLHLLC